MVIIDNLTYLCSKSEQPDSASQLMMMLVELKKRRGLSLLVLAHTPKRIMSNPLTQNDLAGSKRLFNFFDSCFAMGKSSKDEEMRYIKQIKVRAGRFEHGSENVIVGEFERINGFLQFVEKGFSTEQVHLIADFEKAKAQFAESVSELMHTGMSLHKIATQLGVAYAKVQRTAKSNALS